jgi:hypothetical protein
VRLVTVKEDTMKSPAPADKSVRAAKPEASTRQLEPELSDAELNQLTDEMIALIDDVYDPALLNPVQYIHDAIRKLIDRSTAPPGLKEQINSTTPISVSFRQRHSNLGLTGSGTVTSRRERKSFPLDEIVTDAYQKDLAAFTDVEINWPQNYPPDLTKALESANLQTSYQASVRTRLGTPNAKFLLTLQARAEVRQRLERFARRAGISAAHKKLANAYGGSATVLELVRYQSRHTRVDVTQCLQLRWQNDRSADSLMIFLGADEADAVVPLPAEFISHYHFVTTSPKLRRLVLQRMPLYQQIKPGHDQLRFVSVPGNRSFAELPPLWFYKVNEPFEALHALRIQRMLSDIDTLVSTDSERLTDQLLTVGVFMLQALSLAATLPLTGGTHVAARMLVSFLLGQTSAALQVVRGAQADTPQEAAEHYDTALLAALVEIVGPLARKLLGKTYSLVSQHQVASKVLAQLKHLRPYPFHPLKALNKT